MPKVNPTLLDRLIGEGKIVSRKPEIIQATTIRDPLGYSMLQRLYGTKYGNRKNLNMTPERMVYQEGIDARLFPRMRKADELVSDRYDTMDEFKDEWSNAVEEAKSDMADDWASTLDYQDFDEVNPDILEDVELPSNNLRDYWPSDARDPDEIYSDFDAAQDAYYAAKDEQRMLRSPQTRMMEQTMTPRYRRYQEAMQQRAANKHYGRMIAREEAKRRQLDAYVRDMLRSGMTMEDVRRELGAVRDAVPGSQNYDDLRQSYGPNWNGLKRTLRGGR